MKKRFLKLLSFSFKKKITVKNSIENQRHLKNDLQRCFTNKDIEALKGLLKYCTADFTTAEFIEFNLNLLYRKSTIDQAKYMFGDHVCTVGDIKKSFNSCFSYLSCDAILLHIEINKEYYHSLTNDVDIYNRMATKQKTAIYEEFQTVNNQ